MPNRDNASIARSMLELFNKRDMNASMNLVSDECQWTDMARGITFRGKDGFRQWEEAWFRAFPDARVEISNVVASGEYVVNEYIGHGTQNGPLMGPEGEIPPTGNWVEIRLCDILRMRDGQVIEGRTYYDAASILRQLRAGAGEKRAAA